MPRFDTGQPARHTMRALLCCAAAVTLATAPSTAQAAVPNVGAWESDSRTDPRVSFDVQGPVHARRVLRVSFPIFCRDDLSPRAWGATRLIRMRPDGRFTAYNLGAVIRGRFTAKNRALITARTDGFGNCRDTRRYIVRHRGPRLAVRPGHYLALVGGTAAIQLDAAAFGRIAHVRIMRGSVPSGCSDGSQRPLTLAGPEGFVLAAPILSNGRFEISAAAESSITIVGAFTAGSVAAHVELSTVLPDGTRCTATLQTLVGSLLFPDTGTRELETVPDPPLIPLAG